MPNRFKTATGLVVALVLSGVAVSSHAQTAGLAYRLTVTIDGFSKSCGEALGPEYYVTVTRLDLEVENQRADAIRDATLIAASVIPRKAPYLSRMSWNQRSAPLNMMEFLRARKLNSELDPLSETERRSLERLRGVRWGDHTDDEEQELEALESRETLSSAESRKLQRLEELMTRRSELWRQLYMRTSPESPGSLRVYLNDELSVVLRERDFFQDDTCLGSRVVLDRSVLERQYLEIKQDDEVLLTLRFTPVEE